VARRIIAASIGYIDTAQSPQGQVLYVATEDFTTDSGDTPASTWFQGVLSGDISYKWRVAAPFTGRKPVAGIGALVLANNSGNFDDATGWEFRDGAVTIKMLDVGQDWSAGTVIATAIADKGDFDSVDNLRITLRDSAAILDQNIQQSTYASGDAVNKLKPYCFGTPLSCDPILTDEATRAYDAHDATIVEMDRVMDNGAEVGFSVTDTGFKLSSAATGKITCDPVATGTGNLSVIDDSVETDGATLSNLDRTIQNPNRTFNSPAGIYEITGHSVDTKAASAGGKYYFEMYVDRARSFSGTASPDGWWTSAIGIGAAIPTNGHNISDADEYALWTTYVTNVSTPAIDTWEDGTRIDDDLNVSTEVPGGWEDQTVGVLVSFDDMEVSFRLNGSAKGSTLSITSNSPLDTFYPLIAVRGSAHTDLRTQDNKATLYLHDENFSEAIPAGYESWAGSAYASTTDFSDFITSITDKITGLTVDTTTQAEIDAIGYSYSYYLKDSRTAAQVLFDGCASHSGWYYIGRTGNLTFGRLAEPGGAGVTEFTDAEIIDVSSISTDYAPGLSNRMGALRNWHKLNIDSIDTSLGEDERVLLSEQYQHEASSSNTLASGYNHAIGNAILNTYFRTAANADDEVDRLIALYAQERRFITVDAAFDLSQFILMDLGDTVSIDFDRFGFGSDAGSGAFSSGFSDGWDLGSAGSQYIVLGIEGSFISNRIRLTLWG